VSRPDDWNLTDRLHAPSGKGDPFAAAVRATRMPMLITDPRLNDNPVVFANDAFLAMSGYAREDVMGRNCRFLQGRDTDAKAVADIREAVRAQREIAIEILNYRKDGSEFWNALFVSPVFDNSGELLFFFASQVDVTDRKLSELKIRDDRDRIEDMVSRRTTELQAALDEQKELVHEIDHRVKNNLQLILSLISMEERGATHRTPKQVLKTLKRRIEALSSINQTLRRLGTHTAFDLSGYLGLLPHAISDRDCVNVKLDVHLAPVDAAFAAPLALIASELIGIACDYVSLYDTQRVTLTLKNAENGYLRFCLSVGEEDAALSETLHAESKALIDLLVPQVQGRVSWTNSHRLNQICVDVPAIGSGLMNVG